MRKTFPTKSKPLPTGVKNLEGKLTTSSKEKRKVTVEHFEHRMRKRKNKDERKEVDDLNSKRFEKRIEEARTKKSPVFNMKELEKVLKNLKPGKC